MKKNYLYKLMKKISVGSLGLSIAVSLNASDLQIYAGPGTDGQTTLIMMLDRSGSMGIIADDSANNSIVADYGNLFNYTTCSSGNPVVAGQRLFSTETAVDPISNVSYVRRYCTSGGNRYYDRLTRLKDGMFALLNSPDEKLKKVYIGLGYYSAEDSVSGVIKVAAAPLGEVNSAHRNNLKREIANISAGWSTPTSHAYAEAASYLLGTNTTNPTVTFNRNSLIQVWRTTGTTAYQICATANGTECISGWGAYIYANPNLSDYTQYSTSTNGSWNITYHRGRTTVSVTDQYPAISGFLKSVADSKQNQNYKSPLPTTSASCDGQGIYILSDGQPNNTNDYQSNAIMNKALNDNSFSCDVSDGMVNSHSGSGWKCMGAFARKLYGSDNPKNRSIQTAFVGFGAEFSSQMSDSVSLDTKNACRLGSTKAGDTCSYYQDDELTPNGSTTYRNPVNGFGNGGFFQVASASDVTASVLTTLVNINKGTIEPLSTGSWSVPVDDLNPTGVQPFGYVRAFKPNPGTEDVLWAGNLKKYHVVDGSLSTAVNGGTNVFNIKGEFNLATTDLWGKKANEGGDIYQGGAYVNVPMPTASNPNQARKLYTNFGLDKDNKLTSDLTRNSSLLRVPTATSDDTLNLAFILDRFKNDAVLSKLNNSLKRKLLNYLGYNIEVSNEALPNANTLALQADDSAWNSFGGISHSLPVQVTYSGELNEEGELQNTREQSVLFGTMDGGLRLVNASTGAEQFVFMPSDILNDDWQSLALRKTSTHDNGPAYGTDAPWVVDSTYDFEESKDSDDNSVTKIQASKVSIYGGLRMGGNSYYGLDVTNANSPKFKFRVSSDQADFNKMGQSWSKPVLANIRHNGKIKRVIVVGGGYDTCYEDPRFLLNTNYSNDANKSATFKANCSNRANAKGNAVYIIDAETGERIFWVSNTGADINNTQILHSIVSDISTVDTDADGLIDHLYFGDLGGQVFRVDLNNRNNVGQSQSFGVRAVRIANLATNALGVNITNGDNPRFYEAPTLTMHREKGKKFLLVGLVSGDRSTPLDVAPTGIDRPAALGTVLTARPTNKVFGILDSDSMRSDLNYSYSSTYALNVKDVKLSDLIENPQILAIGSLNSLISNFQPYVSRVTTTTKYGWYRSLSSNAAGLERANGIFRKPGGIKAFEAPVAIKNTLVVSTYDPESQSLGEQDPCQVRVIGESFRQYYCLPFGVCLNGERIDSVAENDTGWQPAKEGDKLGSETVRAPLGKGILGNALVDKSPSTGNCGGLQLGGNVSGTGEWSCVAQTKPMNWYSK